MSKHSVPCWRFSDKDGAVFVSGYSSVHFSVPLFPHLVFVLRQYHDDDLIKSPSSLKAIPEVLVNPDNSLCKKYICRNDLKSLSFVPILSPIQASKEVLTFGRNSAHFREKCARALGKIQVHFTLKTVLRPSLMVRKPSHGIGAHVRGTRCALAGEVNTPTWWEPSAQVSTDSGSCRQRPVRLCKDEYDVGTWRFLRDPVAKMTRHEGEALNGIDR
jgi:hypothetical protein